MVNLVNRVDNSSQDDGPSLYDRLIANMRVYVSISVLLKNRADYDYLKLRD